MRDHFIVMPASLGAGSVSDIQARVNRLVDSVEKPQELLVPVPRLAFPITLTHAGKVAPTRSDAVLLVFGSDGSKEVVLFLTYS